MRKLIVILLFAPSIAISQTENLIRNPGFEYKTSPERSSEASELRSFYLKCYNEFNTSSGRSPETSEVTTPNLFWLVL